MLPLLQPISRDRIIARLTDSEISDPYPVLEDLCDEYNIGTVRSWLWSLVEIALVDDRYNSPKNRMDLLIWYSKLEKALEAIYVLMSIQKDDPLPGMSVSNS